MRQNFAAALAATLKEEGGYANNSHDPGGSTNKGITQVTYDAWRHSLGLPPQDVRQITDAAVQAIYRERYWLPSAADRLPSGIDLVVFDAAVNSGPKEAALLLQHALNDSFANKLAVDGQIGPATYAAVEKALETPSGVHVLIHAYQAERLAFLRRLSTWAYFGAGWTARVRRIEDAANALAHAA